eukprot:CFRG6054T1
MSHSLLRIALQLCTVTHIAIAVLARDTYSDAHQHDLDTILSFNRWLENRDPHVDAISLSLERRKALLNVVNADTMTSILLSEDMYNILLDGSSVADDIKENFEVPFAGTGTLQFGCFEMKPRVEDGNAITTNGTEIGKESEANGFVALFAWMGSTYRAHMYGDMQDVVQHKTNVTVQGIIFKEENVVALWENKIRERRTLSRREDNSVEAIVATNDGLIHEVFSDRDGFELAVKESHRALRRQYEENIAAITTIGKGRRYLIIPVDFSDDPGYPADFRNSSWKHQNTVDLFESSIRDFFIRNSYGKLDFDFTYIEEPIRMPKTKSFYQSISNGYFNHYTDLFADAELASGFRDKNNNYDTYIVLHSRMNDLTWSGLGLVGGEGVVINGEIDLRVIGHEIGHNLGSWHANSWIPAGNQNPIDVGSVAEYNDAYAAMGISDSTGRRHFAARTKEAFGWIPSNNVQMVTTSGTYTVYAHDQIDDIENVNHTVVLRIPMSHPDHNYEGMAYDVELRGLDVWKDVQDEGVVVRMVLLPEHGFTMQVCNDPIYSQTVARCNSASINSNGLMLDFNLRTKGDTSDGLLQSYMSFSDLETRVHVRVSRYRGTKPAESILAEVIVGTNDCWEHGTFLPKGACKCDAGFYGIDCAFETDAEVEIHLHIRMTDIDAWYTLFGQVLNNRGYPAVFYNVTHVEHTIDGSIYYLSINSTDAKQDFRQLVIEGDSIIEQLAVRSMQESGNTVYWPYTDDTLQTNGDPDTPKSNDNNLFGLPTTVIYVLLAVIAVVIGTCSVCFYVLYRRRKQKKRKHIPANVSNSMDTRPGKCDDKPTNVGIYPHLEPQNISQQTYPHNPSSFDATQPQGQGSTPLSAPAFIQGSNTSIYPPITYPIQPATSMSSPLTVVPRSTLYADL